MIPELQTRRLILKPPELSDAPQIQELFPHWEIVRFLDKIVPWPYPPDGAHSYLKNMALPMMGRGEAWYWTLRLKTAPEQVIGFISLSKVENHNRGFWMGLPWQGQGLMSEAVVAVTDYWFNVLKFSVLRAPKAIMNDFSRRISVKSGMRVIATEERDYVGGRFLSELWEITAEEWNNRRSKPATDHSS